MISENRVEWVLAQMGAGLVGAVTVGVYPTSPTNEVAYVLGHADVEIVVCEDQEQTDKVLAALPELPRLKSIVVMETKGLRQLRARRCAQFIATFAEVEAARRRHRGQQAAASTTRWPPDARRRRPDDLHLGLHRRAQGRDDVVRATSAAWCPASSTGWSSAHDTTHLSYLPLCHVAEQMLTSFVPLYLGSQVNFGESIRTVQEDLREVAPTMFLGVPRIWEKLHAAISIKLHETGGLRRALFHARLAKPAQPLAEKPRSALELGERADLRRLLLAGVPRAAKLHRPARAKVALTGAAPIPPDVVRFFRTLGVPLVEVYGLTESTGMVTGHRLRRCAWSAPSACPRSGVEWRIAKSGDDWAASCRSSGDMVFAGYYKNPEATAAQHHRRLAAHRRRGAPR